MVAEQGDQKELPAGQEGGWRLVCANPGPEVFRGTWGTSRRGRQSCTVDELISQHPHPPHEEEGRRPRERGGRGGREKAVTVLSSFWYKHLPEPTILLQ